MEESPVADFHYTPENPNTLEREVRFFENAKLAAQWRWQFDDEGTSKLPNPIHTFRDTGLSVVTLIVTHDNGCRDTLSRVLDVEPIVRYFLPNAFSPNSDGVNEEFFGVGSMEGARDFHFSIWNRWGELLFESTDPTASGGWNGKTQNVGKDAPAGTYTALVSYRDPRGRRVEHRGAVILVR
jgi:gliding motility-associated-like protein